MFRNKIILERCSPEDFSRVGDDSVGDQEELVQQGQGEDQACHQVFQAVAAVSRRAEVVLDNGVSR